MRSLLTTILLFFAILMALASPSAKSEARLDTLLKVRYNQALAATRVGLYNDALHYWLEYLEMAEKDPRKVQDNGMFTAYLAVGSIHFSFEDYESSVNFFQKGNELAKQKGEKSTQIRFLNNMVGAYAELRDIARSDSCNEKMREIAKELNLKSYDHNYLFNKGYCARISGNFPEALRYMRTSLGLIKEDSLKESPVYAYSELYLIFESMGQLDSALYYLHRFQELADKPILQLDCYKGLMRVYTKLGDNDNSLKYQNLYFHLSDSVLNSREFLQLRNSYLFNEKQKTQRHIAGLQENLFRSRVGVVLVSIVLLLIIAVVVILFRQKKRLNSMNADLFERNRELVNLHDRLAEEWKSRKNVPNEDRLPPQSAPATVGKGEYTDNKRRQDDLLARIIDFLETSDKFLDPEFSLAQLAKEMDSNTKYVSQVINERTGRTFRVFINENRIKVAQARMLDYEKWGQLTIKSIGESVGFKSPANFIAAFKKATGMTPSLFLTFSKSKNNTTSPTEISEEE